MRSLAPLVCCVLVLAAIGPHIAVGQASQAGTTASRPAEPSIHAVYPDPVAGGDAGEFVVLDIPDGTDIGQYAITDGDGTAGIPNTSARGRVVLSTAPNRTRGLTDRPVVGLDGHLALANGGERVRLQRANQTVDAVRYTEAVEGELGEVNGSVIRWRPLGATDRPVVRAAGGEVQAFTLPDSPAAPMQPIRNATERVYLAGYTLSSARVADALIAAQRRGATVRVLLEGEPVGSRTAAEARTLDRLTDAGVPVRVVTGPRTRYRYHHAKYAVADGRAVVLTENWKPAGTGGNSSRGWGVITAQRRVVDGLNQTFRSDAGWQDSERWGEYRQGRQFEQGEPATGSYPSEFRTESVAVQRTDLLVTPDNAQGKLVATIDDADDSIDVIQPTVGDWESPLLRALRRAASRGVEVRLLLSDAWYVREENTQTAQRFREWADRNDASLTAKVADPAGRYEKIHAKGAVIDNKQVVVGSLNWNEAAATSNREVVLVLHGRDAADYFGAVFDADWGAGGFDTPIGALVALLGLIVVAGLAARRVSFEA
ncbi:MULTISPECIES: phosphatidylserine/phosphatidylglycerophosphate/cardiolipin synthase family protein [unclassified Haloarcula]|uniref:phospholipase D-like domain-containing protein n=1 Tax=unclassified Haloarcula TaxID=2624677 RepID=UPI0012471846|nr:MULTISPECIES: phospholipase D-like domain-containing protein [unclassified Haloarcula]KAA9406682.1 phospholipase [Haloarcula sp. CBA1131]MUV50458.1 phospholipase [Haloarcula sp. CBA1122]